jgi:glycine/D-amino acid oxidase-like deaminating enzyme
MTTRRARWAKAVRRVHREPNHGEANPAITLWLQSYPLAGWVAELGSLGIMSTIGANEYAYVAWQNRANRFYLAARRLYHADLLAPAAYCAAMSLEPIFTAALTNWDKSFAPETAGHALAKLARMVGNKVPKAKGLAVPNYFSHEQRYFTVSRYAQSHKGVGNTCYLSA